MQDEAVPVVALLCQFGQPVRGVSPYGDALIDALQTKLEAKVHPVDYLAPYPSAWHPAGNEQSPGSGMVHWARPSTWRRLVESDFQVIHIQHWSAPMASYLSVLAGMAKRVGKRVVVTVHNPQPHERLVGTALFERRLYERADVLVVHNNQGASILRRRIRREKVRIVIVPHGIRSSGTPAPARCGDHARLGLDPARKYVCLFGNLRGYKGVEVLLTAWARVAGDLRNVDLVIAGRLWSGRDRLASRLAARVLGSTRDEQRLRSTLSNPALKGRVHLLEGFRSDDEIDSLLRVSEFAVFPYIRFSSQSGAACRAAGLGCPVLVSDIGGLPDLTIDPTWVVPPNDVDALATTIRENIHRVDLGSARRQQLSLVERYDWSRVADAHVSIYRELSGEPGQSRKQ